MAQPTDESFWRSEIGMNVKAILILATAIGAYYGGKGLYEYNQKTQNEPTARQQVVEPIVQRLRSAQKLNAENTDSASKSEIAAIIRSGYAVLEKVGEHPMKAVTPADVDEMLHLNELRGLPPRPPLDSVLVYSARHYSDIALEKVTSKLDSIHRQDSIKNTDAGVMSNPKAFVQQRRKDSLRATDSMRLQSKPLGAQNKLLLQRIY